MKIYRRTSLFSLYPIVDFSFSADGQVYTLKQRIVSRRANKITFILQKKGTREKINRHFTFLQLGSIFVYLRDDRRTSPQPKTSVCLTYNCL